MPVSSRWDILKQLPFDTFVCFEGPSTWAMASGKPDVMMMLLNKLLDDGNVLYKVCTALYWQCLSAFVLAVLVAVGCMLFCLVLL